MSRIGSEDRVLVRLPSWLGDLVAAEPLVRTLYERAAASGRADRLTLALPPHLEPLLEDRFPRAARLAAGRREELSAWRGHDWVLLLNGSLRSALAAWRAGIPNRVGLASGGRGPLLTLAVDPARERGALPSGLGRHGSGARLLPRPFDGVVDELAGLVGVTVRRRRPLLVPTDDARWRVVRRLRVAGHGPDQPFVLVNVGSREGSSKALPASSWVRLLEELRQEVSLPLLLVGGPGEEARVEAVRAQLEGPGIHALTGPVPQLPELVALCAAADAVLCTDGGVRHVARAVHAPTLVLFGPTDPRHTADHAARERHVRTVVPCGPCHLERCPLEGSGNHACMTEMPLDEALEAALERVREGGRIRALRR